MPSRDTQRELVEKLCRSGMLAGARVLADAELGANWVTERGIIAVAEGDVVVNGTTTRLRIGLCPRFPSVLPRIFVHPPDALGRVPHVERDGYVCFLADEGVIIDRRNLTSALERCVELAIEVLADARSVDATTEVLRELEAYWRELPGRKSIDSYVAPDDRVRTVTAYVSKDRKYVRVADGDKAVQAFESGRTTSNLTQRNALYIPVGASVGDKPLVPESLLTLEGLNSFIERHASVDTRKALAGLTKKWKSEELVVLRIPRPQSGDILIGLTISGIQNAHPLAGGISSAPLTPLSLDRRDRAAIVPRGGANMKLQNAHVLVVGCGSVGSHAAIGLAYAGIGRLTLVDPESLEAENAFRHAAGVFGEGEAKVDALKLEIERRVPYVEVTATRGHVELLLEEKKLSLSYFDGVVVALGAPTLELLINQTLWDSGATSSVFTWLEPEGIGGHALLAMSRREKARGCMECLYAPAEPGGALRNRADFAAPGQSFVRDHAGCGGRYTSFSALHARRTADLAVELLLEALAGEVEGHPLRSWKGDGRRFVAAGYRTSARYDLSVDRLRELSCSYARETCSICGHQ
jgi:hypothetical protein